MRLQVLACSDCEETELRRANDKQGTPMFICENVCCKSYNTVVFITDCMVKRYDTEEE